MGELKLKIELEYEPNSKLYIISEESLGFTACGRNLEELVYYSSLQLTTLWKEYSIPPKEKLWPLAQEKGEILNKLNDLIGFVKPSTHKSTIVK